MVPPPLSSFSHCDNSIQHEKASLLNHSPDALLSTSMCCMMLIKSTKTVKQSHKLGSKIQLTVLQAQLRCARERKVEN